MEIPLETVCNKIAQEFNGHMASGLSVKDSYDLIFGVGAYRQMADDLWEQVQHG